MLCRFSILCDSLSLFTILVKIMEAAKPFAFWSRIRMGMEMVLKKFVNVLKTSFYKVMA